MWLWIFIGFGLGMTITTIMYSAMIMRANIRNKNTSKTVEALLIRKAEATERIAYMAERTFYKSKEP